MARKEWARIRCESAGARYGGEMPFSGKAKHKRRGSALLFFKE